MAASSYSIKKVAVLGAGVMDQGIAAHLANAGIPSVLYDIVPGGKVGIGLLMLSLNLLNLGGFIFALVLEHTDSVSMVALQVFMATVGFASVLPVSLPFQIYSMAIGGVAHCGMLVATFEFFAQCVEAVLDLINGSLLEQKLYGTWLALNVVFAVLGTFFMALFYWLDWRTAPKASVLTAVPSMNFIARQSSKLRLWAERFECTQASCNSCASLDRMAGKDASFERSLTTGSSYGTLSPSTPRTPGACQSAGSRLSALGG